MLTPVIGASIIENREKFANYDFSHLRAVAIGGAKLCPKQLLEYMKIFPSSMILAGYGMTETAGILLDIVQQKEEELQGSKTVCIGVPVPGWRYRVKIINIVLKFFFSYRNVCGEFKSMFKVFKLLGFLYFPNIIHFVNLY